MAIGLEFGKYRLIAELGHGGMADVFLAMVCGPTGSGFLKLAVVKRLRSNLVEDVEFITMLVDEARITARLNHPNVVQMLEVGTVGEEYFLAMEYLEGQPLHRIQKRCKRLGTTFDTNLEYLVIFDALAGLHHAHELSDYNGESLGIVHRDITPQNVLVTYDGQTKVVDFGIAKAAGRASETRQGIVKGKVRYMSPEQAMGQQVDRRADIFSIGVLLWEAATGERFWRDQDDLSIVQSLVGGDFDPSPKSVKSDVSDAIDVICRRALAHRADDRYSTAAELQADLELVLGSELVDARRRLGPKVVELFAKERGQLRAIVEQAGRESASVVSLEVLAADTSGSTPISDGADSLAPVTRRPTPFPVRYRQASTRPAASVVPDNVATIVPPPVAREPEGTEVSMLGFIPRKKRFGAGLLFGAATMLVSVLVAIVAVTAVVAPAQGTAALAEARVPRIAADQRIGFATSHATARFVPAEVARPVAPSIPWTAPARPAATTAPTAPSPSPAASSAPNHVNHLPPPRRLHPIDMNDPWG